ncbi:hypothetical protein GCM10020001_101810 [Nonomuraea salmonea]
MEGAFAAVAVGGGVADGDGAVVADGVGDGEQNAGVGRCVGCGGGPGRGGEGERAEEGVEPVGEASGQDAADLDGGGLRGRAGALCGDEAEQDGQRLLIGEHERRQAVAGGEAVAAVAAADRFDRDVEVDEVVDVAAHGAFVDAEAVGQLGDGAGAARLEQLQEGEDAGGGSRHVLKSAADTGRILPGIRSSL